MTNPRLTDAEREVLVGAVAAAINYQSFGARCNQSDLSMAEEIVHVTSAATHPGGVIAVVEQILAERAARPVVDREALAAAIVMEFGLPVGCDDITTASAAIESRLPLIDEWIAEGIFRDERDVKAEALRDFAEVIANDDKAIEVALGGVHYVIALARCEADRITGGAS